MSDTVKRLAEIVIRVKELDLTKEDKENDNAMVFLALIDDNLSVQIDGTMNNIANMMLSVANQNPAFGQIIKDIAAEL